MKVKKKTGLNLSLRWLKSTTGGFNERNYVGRFQFGKVYRGRSPCGKKPVAVKIWDRFDSLGNKIVPIDNLRMMRDDSQLLLHFEEENELHPNIALYEGLVCECEVFACVYVMNPLSTLRDLIPKDDFTWYKRIKSLLGLASALSFLHTHVPPILLRNLDAAHVLLDQDYTPILYDFSMVSSTVCTDWTNLIHGNAKGSRDYTDPSLQDGDSIGKWSDKSDVFAFGVVLLCLISKRIYTEEDRLRSAPFVYEWAKSEFRLKKEKKCLRKDIPSLVHESLQSEKHFYVEDGYELTKMALQCVEYDPNERPDMKTVFSSLLNLRVVRFDGSTIGIDNNKVLLRVGSGSGSMTKCIINPALVQAARKKGTRCCKFSYKDLCHITDDFNRENFIGNFLFGKLYHGKIGKRAVTVKRYGGSACPYTCLEGNKNRLMDELALFQHPRIILHSGLVSPIGYCYETKTKGEREVEYVAIVYDIDPLDSVDNLSPKDNFTWLQRVKVALKFATILTFFHTSDGCNLSYIIYNLSTEHILVDQDYNPHLCDFGMVGGGIFWDRIFEKDTHLYGSYGFLDPELSDDDKRDVYAFGIILLLLLLKEKYKITKCFPKLADKAYKEKVHTQKDKAMFSLVHESLQNDPDFSLSDGPKITKLALNCIQYYNTDRPTMSQVVRRLRQLSCVSNNKEFFDID